MSFKRKRHPTYYTAKVKVTLPQSLYLFYFTRNWFINKNKTSSRDLGCYSGQILKTLFVLRISSVQRKNTSMASGHEYDWASYLIDKSSILCCPVTIVDWWLKTLTASSGKCRLTAWGIRLWCLWDFGNPVWTSADQAGSVQSNYCPLSSCCYIMRLGLSVAKAIEWSSFRSG